MSGMSVFVRLITKNVTFLERLGLYVGGVSIASSNEEDLFITGCKDVYDLTINSSNAPSKEYAFVQKIDSSGNHQFNNYIYLIDSLNNYTWNSYIATQNSSSLLINNTLFMPMSLQSNLGFSKVIVTNNTLSLLDTLDVSNFISTNINGHKNLTIKFSLSGRCIRLLR